MHQDIGHIPGTVHRHLDVSTPTAVSNSTLQSSRPILSGFWLLLVGIGGVAAGWLLAAFALPGYGWLIAFVLLLYLAQVGPDGIAIANIVLVMAMTLATLLKAWPSALDALFPNHDARQWATVLIVIWIGGIGWLVLLGYGRSHLQRVLQSLGLPGRYAAPLMAGLALIAVLLGRLVHRG